MTANNRRKPQRSNSGSGSLQTAGFIAAGLLVWGAGEATFASDQSAHADILNFRAEAHAGGARGKGLKGTRKDEAFSENSPLTGYGVLVGAEVLFVDVFVEHHQFAGDGRIATWTNFALGFDIELDMGESVYASAGVNGGYGVGTGQQVVPPLDASELSDKGFYGEARFDLGYKLAHGLRIGATVPVSYGYYFKTGDEDFVNDEDTHYQALNVGVFLNLAWNIKVL